MSHGTFWIFPPLLLMIHKNRKFFLMQGATTIFRESRWVKMSPDGELFSTTVMRAFEYHIFVLYINFSTWHTTMICNYNNWTIGISLIWTFCLCINDSLHHTINLRLKIPNYYTKLFTLHKLFNQFDVVEIHYRLPFGTMARKI